ncbi:hypothetical protein [Streptacidiphilus sp. P02-A3a]|uniref:hypothetical protein n=1 Tax=Streptacidiphilus sp. P02-A3a TaxID=2704468 RepID=UPI0015FA71D0|nr:hypothetical protein [Streptacidiphilus sp. P02-A3a]QMU68087.1 hypothetical protein GXP74_07480 [Streptacidiphilus sp. P02-A3a]
MALTGPGGSVMTREEVDRALARLGAEREAVQTSLLALQDHPGCRLLEGATLTGRTLERWSAAEPGLGRLWSMFDTYTEALAAARAVRSRRNRPNQAELQELTELLRGTGVTVSAGRAANGGLSLTGGARLSEQVSLTELVERMNGWYGRIIEVASAADAVWSALPARIDLLLAELGRVRALARSVGVHPGEHPAGDTLEEMGRELASLRAEVVSDPLAFWTPRPGGGTHGGRDPVAGTVETGRYDRSARALDDLRLELQDVLRLRDDADERLEGVGDLLARADATLAEARRARGEVLAKIASTEVPAVPGPASALRERLSQADQLRRHGQWHRLGPLLDTLEGAAQRELLRARESLTAVTAPLALRAELRGRLDAYKAMGARLGVSEDPELIERYDQARRMLWSAPCDLRAAEHAVRRYQQALRPGQQPGQAQEPGPHQGQFEQNRQNGPVDGRPYGV